MMKLGKVPTLLLLILPPGVVGWALPDITRKADDEVRESAHPTVINIAAISQLDRRQLTMTHPYQSSSTPKFPIDDDPQISIPNKW